MNTPFKLRLVIPGAVRVKTRQAGRAVKTYSRVLSAGLSYKFVVQIDKSVGLRRRTFLCGFLFHSWETESLVPSQDRVLCF